MTKLERLKKISKSAGINKAKIDWIREQLFLLRAELESAIKEVNENDKRDWLSSCRCQQNAFANTKFGFAVGYAKGACQRILDSLRME